MTKQPIRQHKMTTLGLFLTVLDQLCDGDLNHPLRKHITIAQAEKYTKALERLKT